MQDEDDYNLGAFEAALDYLPEGDDPESEDSDDAGPKLFKGWIYNWQRVPLSSGHEDAPGDVLVGRDDDGARVITAKVVRFTAKTVETTAGRWRLGDER